MLYDLMIHIIKKKNLMMHIIVVVNLKCFGCFNTKSFLDACLVPVWEGYLS